MVKKWSVSYPAVNGTEQRRVYVYLPTMYEADPDRRYPVLYMFDGQNVFFRICSTIAGSLFAKSNRVGGKLWRDMITSTKTGRC